MAKKNNKNKAKEDYTPREAKVLVYDIETSPYTVQTWGLHQADALRTIQDSIMMSFAYKWLGERKVHCHALPDFPEKYKKDKFDDTELAIKLHALFDEADILIAHNGDRFDKKRAQKAFLKTGKLGPPSPYRTIDTLKIARAEFNFGSNRLDELGKFLKVGRKIVHTGKNLWFDCLDGKTTAWKKMKDYNKQDVRLLEDVYYELRPWAKNHPNLTVFTGDALTCPKCGSDHVQRRGYGHTPTQIYQRYHCQDCGGWFQGDKSFKAGHNTKPK